MINQVVKKAYKDLTGIVDFKVAGIIGGYFGIIIHESKLEELTPYVDEIINTLYDKFCVDLSKNITDDDMEFITYKSLCGFYSFSMKIVKNI